MLHIFQIVKKLSGYSKASSGGSPKLNLEIIFSYYA